MSDNKKSGDKGAEQIIQWGKSYWIETCFERAEALKPCPIGSTGACCKVCHMGPCRFLLSSGEEKADKGVCGARLSTVASRNFLRMAIAGAVSHSEHARDLAYILLGVANGDVRDLEISDFKKLNETAEILEIDFQGRLPHDVARDVAERLIDDFGRQRGNISYVKKVPFKTLERWKQWDIVPRGMDREVSESQYRTHLGVDHDPDSLLLSSLRVSLADGWGSSMIAADVSDILFGLARTKIAGAGLGIFKEDEVNIVVISHNPVIAKIIKDTAANEEIIEYAKTKGAKGITIGTIFYAGHDLPLAGGFSNQELAIMTGIIEAVIVDSHCIMPSLSTVAESFHTKLISISQKARYPGATYIPYEINEGGALAKNILSIAIDNYKKRTGLGERVNEISSTTGAFSYDYILDENNIRSLNQSIKKGFVRGIVALTGADNPRIQAMALHKYLAEELIGEDVLILSTDSGSVVCAGLGYLKPETALEHSGPGLKKAFHDMKIPPVLNLGTSFDNARVLHLLSKMVAEGSLSDEIGGLPVVIISPEWIAEEDIATCCYFAASGLSVFMGGPSPVKSEEEVQKIMAETWAERFKGWIRFEPHYEKIFDSVLSDIDRRREDLNLAKYNCQMVNV